VYKTLTFKTNTYKHMHNLQDNTECDSYVHTVWQCTFVGL